MGGRLRRVAVVSRDPVLRRFWISQMVSEMGDWIGLLGIAALLYAHTDLALAASASLAALYLPYLFAPLLVGWTAKIPPRTLLIGADVLRAGLILLLLVPGLPAGALLAVVFLASVPTSVYEATRAAAVPEYAPDEETREDALVLFQSTQQAATMLGFLVGGAALVLVGFDAAIALNAASFLISGLLLLGVPSLAPFADAAETARGLLRNGMRALLGRPILRRAVLLSVISASTIMAGEALVVVYATQLDPPHPGYAGPLAALMAFVAATLGLLLPRRRSSAELMRLSAWTMLMGGLLAVAAFVAVPSLVPGMVGYIGLGIISAPGALTYVVAVREMEPAIRAPVFALVQVALMGGQAMVAVLAGGLADRTTVGLSVAVWQIPTILFAGWVLVASFGAYLVGMAARNRKKTARRVPDLADAPVTTTPDPVEPPRAVGTPRPPGPAAAPAASPAAREPGTPVLPATR
jgi:MFS family permease